MRVRAGDRANERLEHELAASDVPRRQLQTYAIAGAIAGLGGIVTAIVGQGADDEVVTLQRRGSRAEGQAEAIRLVNEAAEKYFVGNAQLLKQIEMVENSLKGNAKVILTDKGITPTLFLGDMPTKINKSLIHLDA